MTDGVTMEETLAMLEAEEEPMLEEAEITLGVVSAEKMGTLPGTVPTNHQETTNVEIVKR